MRRRWEYVKKRAIPPGPADPRAFGCFARTRSAAAGRPAGCAGRPYAVASAGFIGAAIRAVPRGAHAVRAPAWVGLRARLAVPPKADRVPARSVAGWCGAPALLPARLRYRRGATRRPAGGLNARRPGGVARWLAVSAGSLFEPAAVLTSEAWPGRCFFGRGWPISCDVGGCAPGLVRSGSGQRRPIGLAAEGGPGSGALRGGSISWRGGFCASGWRRAVEAWPRSRRPAECGALGARRRCGFPCGACAGCSAGPLPAA